MNIWVGKCSKFYSRPIKSWLQGNGIIFYSAHSERNVVAKRLINTLVNIRCCEDVLKTCWRHLEDIFRVTFFVFQDVFKTSLEDVFLKMCYKYVLQTSWKTRNVYWDITKWNWQVYDESIKNLSVHKLNV